MAIEKTKRANLFKKIAEAKVSEGGNNLLDGRYRLAVKATKTEDGFKGSRFVAEFVVVAAQKIPVTELKTGKALDITPNAVGSDVSWVQMLEKHENALGNVKGLIQDLYGEAPESDDDLIEVLTELDDKNSAFGMVIDCSTYRKRTAKNDVEIVIPKWSHVEQSDEDVQKMRQWIESLTSGPVGASA